LYEVSSQKHKFDELIILTMFLNGLPEEYGTMRDSLFSNITLERGLILSRLQQKESLIKTTREDENTQESANRIKQRECFNYGKPGYFARECHHPKKERDAEDKDSRNSQDSSYGKGYSSRKSKRDLGKTGRKD
jgi:hypothetical protein